MSSLVLLNEVQGTTFFDCIGVCLFLCCILRGMPNWINFMLFSNIDGSNLAYPLKDNKEIDTIPSLIKNNLIYLFITSSQTWLYKKQFLQ